VTNVLDSDGMDILVSCRVGDPDSLPRAATPAVVGMRVGGRRRILIPPSAGWVNDRVQPIPPSFGGKRRLAAHRDEPLLLEVQVLRVRPVQPADAPVDAGLAGPADGAGPRIYKLPAPPSPFRSTLLPESPL
jgi:hypothetical protein